jgi:hypothetical protein
MDLIFHFLRCHFVIFEQCCPLFQNLYETLQTTNVNMKFHIYFHVVFHVKLSMTSFSRLHCSHMHCIFRIYFGMFNLVIISFEISQIKHFYSSMYKK